MTKQKALKRLLDHYSTWDEINKSKFGTRWSRRHSDMVCCVFDFSNVHTITKTEFEEALPPKERKFIPCNTSTTLTFSNIHVSSISC